jgi:hypothetical protein
MSNTELDFWSSFTRKKSFKDSGHFGDWRIDGNNYELDFQDVKELVTERSKKVIVYFDDIAFKGYNHNKRYIGENCICCGGFKFKACDTKYPGIIVKDLPNPAKRLYTMIDGRHRLQKMFLSGKTKSEFYVLDYTDVKKKITPIRIF